MPPRRDASETHFICCTCGKHAHDSEEGGCFSPPAAAHIDIVVRTALRVEVDETITKGKHADLCLKVTGYVRQVLTQLLKTNDDRGIETTAIAYFYPGVMRGKKQAKRRMCEKRRI